MAAILFRGRWVDTLSAVVILSWSKRVLGSHGKPCSIKTTFQTLGLNAHTFASDGEYVKAKLKLSYFDIAFISKWSRCMTIIWYWDNRWWHNRINSKLKRQECNYQLTSNALRPRQNGRYLQATFSDTFPLMIIVVFWLKIPLSLFTGTQFTMIHRWFRP